VSFDWSISVKDVVEVLVVGAAAIGAAWAYMRGIERRDNKLEEQLKLMRVEYGLRLQMIEGLLAKLTNLAEEQVHQGKVQAEHGIRIDNLEGAMSRLRCLRGETC
jgi:hypothetical protein